MLLGLIGKVSLFELLYRIDCDLSRAAQEQGCPACGGRLHQAFYKRKPRGSPVEVPEEYSVRMSLCCGEEGCRRRALPASVLFLGRRVYWGAVVWLVTTLRQQRTAGASARQLKRLLGVSHRTLSRWMRWFREVFSATTAWRRCRGRVSAEVTDDELPASLVSQAVAVAETAERGLARCLALLASGSWPFVLSAVFDA